MVSLYKINIFVSLLLAKCTYENVKSGNACYHVNLHGTSCSISVKACLSDYIHIKQCIAMTHPCLPPMAIFSLKLGLGWAITYIFPYPCPIAINFSGKGPDLCLVVRSGWRSTSCKFGSIWRRLGALFHNEASAHPWLVNSNWDSCLHNWSLQ